MAVHDRLTPLYEQVRCRILADIQSGRLAEGDFLPPEPDLCAEHGVSRITLRRAIGDLCAEGRLIRQQGRGTLVAPQKMQQQLISLSGFSETIDGLGRVSSHQVLERGPLADDIGGACDLFPGSPIRFLRLLEIDGRPLTLETLWFDAARFPEVVASVSEGGSFFEALRDLADVRPGSAERQIDVGFPNAREREVFGISSSQPVYRIEKTTFGKDGVVLGISHLVTPCHLVSFHVKT